MAQKALLGIMAVVALGAATQTVATADTQSDARGDIARAREETRQYHDPAVAELDGFLATDECVELPDGSGGMGFHYVNPNRVDSNLVIEQPDAVIYAPQGDRRKLVAIEYIVPDADQDLATDGDRPTLYGRAFDGPMLGHTPEMPVHYDLHVWAWQANPDGTFAQWNPNVDC